MNGNLITKHLMRWVMDNRTSIVVPNYYIGRWECDILKVTKNGLLYEYEIKTSKADFKKDFLKSYKSWHTNTIINKYTHIINAQRVNRFYYVVPKDMISKDEVPDGFGLIYASQYDNYISFNIIKVSKLFKKEKCDITFYKHIATNLSYKLLNAKFKIDGNNNRKITRTS